MKLLKNIKELATLEGAFQKDGRSLSPSDLGIKKAAALVIDQGKILWVGQSDQIPQEYSNISSVDCSQYVITPQIVDSHTHTVFGGNRAFEYSMRLNGADYEAIANAGGGILSTMENTKKESEEQLFKDACERIERIHSYGVGTLEIKSGYALDYEKEKEISRLIHKLKQHFSGKVEIFNTYLAAHAVPKNFKSSKEYLDSVVIPLLIELSDENIIDAVDIFHEQGYFDESDTRSLFNKAKELNIPIKIHADEFNDNNGAAIACEYEALSCDHLLQTSKKGIEELSRSKTVATLLPGTAFFLGKKLANAREFLDAGAKVALASDYNPGSCHCDNLVLLASLAGKNLEMNITEVWAAITLNGAAALGRYNQGAIAKGLDAKFSVFKCNSLDEIIYSWGRNFAVNPQQALDLEEL
ncbi:MAG: imidazolonepropionase [Bacteriovoracaceae bacterium]|nr:imidazolonepropionase [Bacteriovoracaceae bacterium]